MNDKLIELQKKVAAEFSDSYFKIGRPESDFDSMVFIYKCLDSDNSYQNFNIMKNFFHIWESKVEKNKELNDISVENFSMEGPTSINLNSEETRNCILIRLKLSLLSEKAFKLLGDLS